MTLQELAPRVPFIVVAVVGAGAILGCGLAVWAVDFLTKPRAIAEVDAEPT